MTSLTIENINEIIELRKMKREIEALLKAKEAEVKAEMKAKEIASTLVGTHKVTFSTSTSVILDTKRIKDELPEVYEELSKERHTEKLTISTMK